MKTLYVWNSKALVSQLDDYPDGEYWVTKSIMGYRVSIKKPGVKKDSPNDIAVSIRYPNKVSKTPSHGLLISDFRKKYKFDTKLGAEIYAQLERLQNRKEPGVVKRKKGCPGLPIKILFHTLKWVWIQEDRNYPPPQKLGRRMNWSSYILIHNGDVDILLPEGARILKEHGYTDGQIETIRHRSGSRNLQ